MRRYIKLFAILTAVMLALVLALASNRTISLRLTPRTQWALGAVVCIPLAISWGFKLTILPNPP